MLDQEKTDELDAALKCSYEGLFGPEMADPHNHNPYNSSFFDIDVSNKPSKRNMVVMGHRGGFLPGNSLQVFTRAIEEGVQSIELDVSFAV